MCIYSCRSSFAISYSRQILLLHRNFNHSSLFSLNTISNPRSLRREPPSCYFKLNSSIDGCICTLHCIRQRTIVPSSFRPSAVGAAAKAQLASSEYPYALIRVFPLMVNRKLSDVQMLRDIVWFLCISWVVKEGRAKKPLWAFVTLLLPTKITCLL